MAVTTNTLLEKLDGLRSRFEEVSTLITDPSVIADQTRYVRLTKEYKGVDDLNDIVVAKFAKRTPQFTVIKKGGKLS